MVIISRAITLPMVQPTSALPKDERISLFNMGTAYGLLVDWVTGLLLPKLASGQTSMLSGSCRMANYPEMTGNGKLPGKCPETVMSLVGAWSIGGADVWC
ncbi:MAG: hypothetical protein VW499_02300, partial [Candidatus Puniceispirillum sp.]